MIAYALLIVAAQLCSAQMTDLYRQFIIDEHNRVRATVQARKLYELEYDYTLECTAQTFIERSSGKFIAHNNQTQTDYANCATNGAAAPRFIGENFFSGAPKHGGSIKGAVNAWCDFEWGGCTEREALAANNNDTLALLPGQTIRAECAGAVQGHFTQCLSEGARKVGCWYTKSFGTVCNYDYGNIRGVPYVTYGEPCSQCAADSECRLGLCRCNADGLCFKSRYESTIFISDTTSTLEITPSSVVTTSDNTVDPKITPEDGSKDIDNSAPGQGIELASASALIEVLFLIACIQLFIYF